MNILGTQQPGEESRTLQTEWHHKDTVVGVSGKLMGKGLGGPGEAGEQRGL